MSSAVKVILLKCSEVDEVGMLYAIKHFLIYQRAACGSGFTCLRLFPEHIVKLPVHYNNQDKIKKHIGGPRNVFFTEHEVSFETYVLHRLHNERFSLLRYAIIQKF